MDVILLVARVLFAFIFFKAAVDHFRHYGMMAGYTRAKGVPFAGFMVVFTGLMALYGAISIAFGLWARTGGVVLALFLLPTAFLIHNYWAVKDPMARANDQAHFMKDIALVGAALVFVALGTGAYSLTP